MMLRQISAIELQVAAFFFNLLFSKVLDILLVPSKQQQQNLWRRGQFPLSVLFPVYQIWHCCLYPTLGCQKPASCSTKEVFSLLPRSHQERKCLVIALTLYKHSLFAIICPLSKHVFSDIFSLEAIFCSSNQHHHSQSTLERDRYFLRFLHPHLKSSQLPPFPDMVFISCVTSFMVPLIMINLKHDRGV